MKRSQIKPVFITLGALLCLALTVVGGYVFYLQSNYYRIEDKTPLTINNPQVAKLQRGQAYTAVTYNIGFGAYDPTFSFFMDNGVMKDGTAVSGKHARAQSRENVISNLQGAGRTMAALDADFYLLQEVDVDATRSHHVDQVAHMNALFPHMANSFASNFHSVFLAYPLQEMLGSVQSGLLTMSRYAVKEALRRSYPVDNSFVTKFFDLDRCFSVHRLPVSHGAELVLVNSHMSAFDQGGLIRQKQMEFLGAFLTEEAAKGNYVIVGGDFNQALCETLESFPSHQRVPSWMHAFAADKLPTGFVVVEAENLTQVPTCRSTDIPYEKGVNYITVLDGFLISDNITATVQNIDADFQNSDHNPVELTFTLE